LKGQFTLACSHLEGYLHLDPFQHNASFFGYCGIFGYILARKTQLQMHKLTHTHRAEAEAAASAAAAAAADAYGADLMDPATIAASQRAVSQSAGDLGMCCNRSHCSASFVFG
jgi:hypothetical protein